VDYQIQVSVDTPNGPVIAPILATAKDGHRSIIALSGPLTDGHPADPKVADMLDQESEISVFVENELVVRRNLPFATRNVLQKVES
jgi:hypothetical protein